MMGARRRLGAWLLLAGCQDSAASGVGASKPQESELPEARPDAASDAPEQRTPEPRSTSPRVAELDAGRPEPGPPRGDASTAPITDTPPLSPTRGDSADGGASGPTAANPTSLPGCGFDTPAFCETFDELPIGMGRAGEASGLRFSGSRLMPQLPTFDGPFPIGPATTPACRSDLPGSIEPPRDYLLCEPLDTLPSRHLLIVTAAQNYGQNSLRVRQPFDFRDRIGRLRVDAELWSPSLLYGFVSLAITGAPTGVPSFAIDQNYEGGALPQDAVSLQFSNSSCPTPDTVSLTSLITISDFEQTIVPLTDTPCLTTAPGRLQTIEVQIGQGQVSVWGADAGGALQLLTELAAELPLYQGYVQLNVHNHASLKYSEGEATPRDAWSARFDNLGFDGPVLASAREYELPDSLERVEVGDWSGVGIGHYVPEETGAPLVLPFTGVELDGAARARLAFNYWVLAIDLNDPTFLIRLNDGPLRERPLTEQELGAVTSAVGQGASSLLVELPMEDLVSGDNRVELWIRGVAMNYPPAIANVDLIVSPDEPERL